MPKRWHKGGCNQETWTEKCYHCGGNGHRRGNKDDSRDCEWCNGFGFTCSGCGKAYFK